MRRPRRLSSPSSRERRRSRRDTPWGARSRRGTLTRRPSAVTTTATVLRLRPWKKSKRPDSSKPAMRRVREGYPLSVRARNHLYRSATFRAFARGSGGHIADPGRANLGLPVIATALARPRALWRSPARSLATLAAPGRGPRAVVGARGPGRSAGRCPCHGRYRPSAPGGAAPVSPARVRSRPSPVTCARDGRSSPARDDCPGHGHLARARHARPDTVPPAAG